jgi:hypothetical protein
MATSRVLVTNETLDIFFFYDEKCHTEHHFINPILDSFDITPIGDNTCRIELELRAEFKPDNMTKIRSLIREALALLNGT